MDEEKIGFNSHASSNEEGPTGEKKKGKIKFSKPKKTPYEKFAFTVFVFAMIFSILSTGYFFLPLASGIFGMMYALIVIVIIVFSCLITLFLILANDGYRVWIGNFWSSVDWVFNASQHVAEVSTYFAYLCWPALALDILSIIFCSVAVNKGSRFKSYLAFSIVGVIVVTIFIIFFYASGQRLVHSIPQA